MKPPCELVMHRFVPALRAEIAITLYNEKGMNQVEIGRRIGTKQPSVSQYLKGQRGGERVSLFSKFSSFAKHKEIIIESFLDDENRVMTVCDCCNFCKEVREEEGFSKYYFEKTGSRWPCPDVQE